MNGSRARIVKANCLYQLMAATGRLRLLSVFFLWCVLVRYVVWLALCWILVFLAWVLGRCFFRRRSHCTKTHPVFVLLYTSTTTRSTTTNSPTIKPCEIHHLRAGANSSVQRQSTPRRNNVYLIRYGLSVLTQLSRPPTQVILR